MTKCLAKWDRIVWAFSVGLLGMTAIGCSDCDGGSFRQLPSITSPFSWTISNVPGDVKLELLRK